MHLPDVELQVATIKTRRTMLKKSFFAKSYRFIFTHSYKIITFAPPK